MRLTRLTAIVVLLLNAAGVFAQAPLPDRAALVAFAKGGFVLPEGRTAVEMLVSMNTLLASTDPVLRDDVAYSAAEKWILREKRLSPSDLRTMLNLWSKSLDDGLGTSGDDRVFKRSFSALCLSLVAAADLTSPFLEPAEVQSFFDRVLDYFQRERDLRGFDAARGWMHTPAHTSDTLKYLARNAKLAAGSDARLLTAVRGKIEGHDAVFVWGENDRMALALQSIVRRPDADAAALKSWTEHWTTLHRELWANGPQVDPRKFVVVENAKQVMRSLAAALSMETAPTPAGTAARDLVLAALARMR